jgi:hypothetical protein
MLSLPHAPLQLLFPVLLGQLHSLTFRKSLGTALQLIFGQRHKRDS